VFKQLKWSAIKLVQVGLCFITRQTYEISWSAWASAGVATEEELAFPVENPNQKYCTCFF